MSQTAQIRIEIEDAKNAVALDDSLARLAKNRDWKKVVDEAFLKDEPVRLTQLLAHPGMQDEASQTEILNQLKAISYFRAFLARTEAFAEHARGAIEAMHETEAELLKQGLED